MSRLAWYWHRLRAMNAAEIGRHIQKKLAPREPPTRYIALDSVRPFPVQPRKDPEDVKRILAGQWKAFGKVPIHVDDPPRWNCDYLAGVEVPNIGKINHRELPTGADVKMIWELSRWYQLLRLAEAGVDAKCIQWLQDWVEKNPPYQGANWTSALETGIRLIHFTRMDALLSGLGTLREKILPAHAWFTWKERSFGSSANNHLLGELAGLIVASARWPQLEALSAPMDRLQREWERQVLAQFAEDGGNKEQALNYHAFSLELCEQTGAALQAAGRKISSDVEQRIALAQDFYDLVQVPGEHWDYGDSDDAGHRHTQRWPEDNRWHYWPQTGIARYRSGHWDLRWDLSPLGYLATAAHGHLDALHLSMWWKGMPVVIDPGTGAYYGDTKLRSALAGWDAHNGPHLPGQDYPQRLGPFLWSQHHARPNWHEGRGRFTIPQGTFARKVLQVENGWQVDDSFDPHQSFLVRWQFPPSAEVVTTGKQSWRLKRQDTQFDIEVSGGTGELGHATVSPGFRQTAKAAFLELKTGCEACLLRTKFLNC